eukprot:g67156.t1
MAARQLGGRAKGRGELTMYENLARQALGFSEPAPPDASATVCTASNSVFGKRLRHIALRHSHMTEAIRKGEVVLNWVPSEKNRADVLSKRFDSPSMFKKAADTLSGNGAK